MKIASYYQRHKVSRVSRLQRCLYILCINTQNEWPLTEISTLRCSIQRQISRKWYKIELYLQRQTDRKSYVWSIKWCRFQWPWIIPKQDFMGTPLFDVEYLRNNTRYGHGYNGVLRRTYTCSTRRCNFARCYLAKFLTTQSVTKRGLSATAKLLVNTELHITVCRGSVQARPLNETGVPFLLLIWRRCTTC